MNRELREDLEHLIICNDKTITPDLRDDVQMTLDYIDELENKIDKAIEYFTRRDIEWGSYEQKVLLDILRGEDGERNNRNTIEKSNL